MDAQRRLQLRNTELTWRAIEGEVVALDLGRSNYLAVNRSGAVLWDALVGGTDRRVRRFRGETAAATVGLLGVHNRSSS